MVFEIFAGTLVALKALDVITVTWTFVVIICLALFAVEIRLSMQRKVMLDLIRDVARKADDVVDDLQYQIDNKQD